MTEPDPSADRALLARAEGWIDKGTACWPVLRDLLDLIVRLRADRDDRAVALRAERDALQQRVNDESRPSVAANLRATVKELVRVAEESHGHALRAATAEAERDAARETLRGQLEEMKNRDSQ